MCCPVEQDQAGWGWGSRPMLDWLKWVPASGLLEQGTGWMKGTWLCLHLIPTIDDSSEMGGKIGAFLLYIILGGESRP